MPLALLLLIVQLRRWQSDRVEIITNKQGNRPTSSSFSRPMTNGTGPPQSQAGNAYVGSSSMKFSLKNLIFLSQYPAYVNASLTPTSHTRTTRLITRYARFFSLLRTTKPVIVRSRDEGREDGHDDLWFENVVSVHHHLPKIGTT
jgi:hypothetical protein